MVEGQIRIAIILSLILGFAIPSSGDGVADIVKNVRDKDSDSIIVVCFCGGATDTNEGDNEVYSDFSYHIGEAFKKIGKWKLIEIDPKTEKSAARKLNPKGDLLFEIWFKGKAIMKSKGVATDIEIADVLKENKLWKE